MESVSFPPPPTLVGSLEKQTMSKFWDYHRDRGRNTNDCYHLKRQIEDAVAIRRASLTGEKQNCAAEVRNSKVSLTLQRDNGKDGHEKPQDCRQIEEMHSSWKKKQWRQHIEQMSRIREQAILQNRNMVKQRLKIGPWSTEKLKNMPWKECSMAKGEALGGVSPGVGELTWLLIPSKGKWMIITSIAREDFNTNMNEESDEGEEKTGSSYRGWGLYFSPKCLKELTELCGQFFKDDCMETRWGVELFTG
ncbi:hypothetical protein Tco_0763317 [Tanacetum coccineum]